jgi:hypothetical protein
MVAIYLYVVKSRVSHFSANFKKIESNPSVPSKKPVMEIPTERRAF